MIAIGASLASLVIEVSRLVAEQLSHTHKDLEIDLRLD